MVDFGLNNAALKVSCVARVGNVWLDEIRYLLFNLCAVVKALICLEIWEI